MPNKSSLPDDQAAAALDDGPGLSYDDSVENSSTAIAIIDEAIDDDSTVNIMNRNYTAAPNFDREDMSMPRLRLAQGIMVEVQEGNAKPGDFLLEGHKPVREAILVPLVGTKCREYRDGENQMMCQSADAKIGIGKPGGECSTCPLAQWTDNPATGKRKSPACTLIYSYIFWSETHGQLVTFDFKRTGQKTGQTMNTIFERYKSANVAVTLSSKLQKMGPAMVSVPGVVVTDVPRDVLDEARRSFF